MKLSFFSSRKIASRPFREVLPPRLCCNTSSPFNPLLAANFPILKYCGMGMQDKGYGMQDTGYGLRVTSFGFCCLEGIGAKKVPAQGQDSKNLNRGFVY